MAKEKNTGAESATADKPNEKPAEEKPAEKPAETTAAPAPDVKALIAEERRKWEAEAAEDKRKEKEAADRKKAEEDGRWEELADAERKKREAAETEAANLRLLTRRSDVRDSIRDYLAEHHKEYVGVEKYILPLVDFDLKTDPAEIAKRVKAAADQYVKDNPRGGSSGVIPARGAGNKIPASEASGIPQKNQTNQHKRLGVAL
jgi:Skp family chaperone for outer membrane proteins